MDLIKIGRFIAEERKNKNYTQKQLADILVVSDRTISKWECGKGFPESALLLPLCNELEITVNELLAGERLEQEKYLEKAEQNMVEYVKEKQENKTKLLLILLLGIISSVSFVTLLLIICLYTDVISMQVKGIVICIACGIFATGLLAMMKGGRTVGYYKCLRCKKAFVPEVVNYTMGFNLVSMRLMKCPKCKKIHWCKKVLTKEE